MTGDYLAFMKTELETIKANSLYKYEKELTSPQGIAISIKGKKLLNFCANNYLGLANHPKIKEAAKKALDKYGFGMASVRFICGTGDLHKELEARISQFLGKEDTILYSSCFDANTGLFETLLGEEDAILSDSLNHASIIDGVRLCKAKRYRYQNGNLSELEKQLKESSFARFRMICTDGVFSMDGYYADLKKLAHLAREYKALLMVDDSHAVGFVGEKGQGTHELFQVSNDVDILTGTLGKALGGASGGYVSGPKDIISFLRQKSRPYLFSNSLAPVICAASLVALDLVEKEPELRKNLHDNTSFFRKEIKNLGFSILEGSHPIIPVMIRDDAKATEFARSLLEEGIYAVAFSYPVVPQGSSRIRLQLSAAHTKEDLERALSVFEKLGKKHGIIS
jgi:glycine C-acetyltransferase